MRIIDNTPEALLIVHNPWIMQWGLWVASAVVILSTLLSTADSIDPLERLTGSSL